MIGALSTFRPKGRPEGRPGDRPERPCLSRSRNSPRECVFGLNIERVPGAVFTVPWRDTFWIYYMRLYA
jgi:homogentisate 1,2-dioxygenase